MRLLFISSQYPPYELGGYEQWCYEVTQALKCRGHVVRVLTSNYGVESSAGRDSDGVNRSLHLTADFHYYRPADFFLKRYFQERADLRELRRAIEEFQPDVVMVWGMFCLSWCIPYWAEQWMPGRVVYYIASYWPIDPDPHTAYWESRANRPVMEWIKRPLRRLAKSQLRREGYPPRLGLEHAVCCSNYVRATLSQAGALPQDAGVIYGGVEPAAFLRHRVEERPAEDRMLHLLYFGRLVPDKGVHTAIEALGSLRQQGLADGIDLTIVGDGHPDYKSRLHAMVQNFQIEDCVHFVGRVASEEIPTVLSRFDIFLFTSTWPEPFGRTIVEAMLTGLVVIGADVGGSREIFQYYDEEMLYQPEDWRGLAERILRVGQDPELRRRLSGAGRQMVLERFTLAHMTDQIENNLLAVATAPCASCS